MRLFEAFAGIGAFSQALKNIGFKHELIGISEISEPAIIGHEALHGRSKNFGCIKNVLDYDIPPFDVFTYGFPCQDITRLGAQRGLGEGTRSGLLWECEAVIEKFRPSILIMENVKPLVKDKFKLDFAKWLLILNALGYNSSWEVLNSLHFGLPQHRERVFLVSKFLDKPFDFERVHKHRKPLPDLNSFTLEPPSNWLLKRLDAQVCSAYSRMVKMGRLDKARIRTDYVNTITCDNYNVSTSFISRNGRPSVVWSAEALKLQGFTMSDYYKLYDAGLSEYQIYKLAGNSIPVNILEAIFTELLHEN